jgi:hypothetical protein
MRCRFLVPALVALLAPAAAVAKPQSVCGSLMLPLAEGNSWTYERVAAPMPAPPTIERIAPLSPKSFTISVTSVEKKNNETVVTLEEKLTYDFTKVEDKPIIEERVVTSTITCGKKKFDISPESFFFAAEPGGFGGFTLDSIERKGTSWQFGKSAFGTDEWRDDLVIKWTRKPAEGSGAKYGGGKLEMERKWTPVVPEQIHTKMGSYKAEKLALTTTGRVTLDAPLSSDMAPMELPADWINQLWFVEGIGVVQTLNSYAHMYQLVNATVK